MESRPYEESAQYLGKPYNTLTQNDVRSELKEKWTNIQQDQYDVSSIDGSTFKMRQYYKWTLEYYENKGDT